MSPPGTILPSSPLSLCEDRFSLLPDSNDLLVPTWSLVVAALTAAVHTVDQLIEKLEIFSICLHRREASDLDFSQLNHFLHHEQDTAAFLTRVYPELVQLALELPLHFSSGVLPALSPSFPSHSFSRRQIACLVVHQFLCTLSAPSWMLHDSSPDFHIWYNSAQPHKEATRAYLHALFVYFDRVTISMPWITELTVSEWPVSLTLRSSHSLPSFTSAFAPLTIKSVSILSTDSSLLGLPSGATIVFANKYIGFGQTGTQEEMHIGCSPEACPAMLFTPPLQDDQVLVLEGVEAMISMEGYGRDARLGMTLRPDYERGNFCNSSWRKRTMIFMDALELDNNDFSHLIPDLLPGHIDRELTKAYIAFSSRCDTPFSEVVTGLWGCGAFGGNPEIKTILQWCAASLAGVPLTFICEKSKEQFLHNLQDFAQTVVQRGWTVDTILTILRCLRPEEEAAKYAMTYIVGRRVKTGK